jgi:hypothetical protein
VEEEVPIVKNTKIPGVVIAGVDVMSWPLHVAGPVAQAAHPAAATHDAIPAVAAHDAIPAMKRRTAAASVASVNRGTT